eukprot:CAMPEP_0172483018 /NCGR_PEP_ID=MMETSP1066-20121228/9796_1 /TAXON_ID=671091 /ORGANISM="Coscinodiscus wailesii, Strain CCMP2513" /LENGTH=199 /DNA_ID=CAMNT_0013246633 /DNA_START=184 /DNA_END=784 /DNA_ORIENTATION=+
MKPDWDKLMSAFSGSATQLVADVDCTAAGKPLCESNGVKGYPTIKWGDPSDLQDYQGGRDYESLKTFAEENLKPVCSPANIELCDEGKKKEIETFMSMADADLDAKIASEEKKISDAESLFETELQKLQSAYQKLMDDKDKTIADVKAAGLGLMKSCKAAKAKGSKDELYLNIATDVCGKRVYDDLIDHEAYTESSLVQ